MLINAIDPEESRIAVVSDGVLQELHVELASREAYLGNIYKGKVVNIEPSIGAAFVSFGGRVNGFLHVSDVLPAYGRPEFQLNDVIEGRARVDVEEGPESVQQALADDDDDEPVGEPAARGPAAASRARAGRDEAEAEGVEAAGSEPEHDAEHDAEHEHEHDADQDADAEPREEGEGEVAESGDADSHGDGDDDGNGETEIHDASVDAQHFDGDESADDRRESAAEPVVQVPRDDVSDVTFGEPSAGASFANAAASEPFDHELSSAEVAAGDAADDRAEPGDDQGHAPATGDAATATATEGGRADTRPVSRRNRHRHREQNPRKRPRASIDQLLKKGQEVVVQVTKEGIGTKGPTLSTYVSLPGRCLVLMPSLPKCGVSRKIEDSKERRRLKRIVRELDETGQGGIGFIVRTAGVQKSLADLERDRDYLKKIWEMVAQRLKVTRAPALLYQESDLVLKAMRDLFTPDIAEVVVDSEDVFMRIKDFADKLMPHMADRIRLHEQTTPLFHSFGIEKEVEALYQPKVDLQSGASIVIDQTEALVAIDVNSGKFKPGADLEETAYRTNMEAIPDIVRQLRLRDLGGLIIIDFIDMAAEKHRRGIERRLIEALRGDRARIKVGRISPFGMLEITRQRVGPGLKRTVFTQCPHCKGAGWARTVQSKALSVLREVRALVNLKGYSVLQVFAAPAVNDYLVNYKRRPVLDVEDAVGKTIVFRPELSYPIDVVHYRFLTGDGQEARIAIPAGLGVKA